MKLLLLIISAFLFINDAQSLWTPKPKSTWNYLIAAKEIDILNRPEEVLTIDINNSHLIPELHKQGKKVICYFSGGTIEKHREDKDQYLAHDEMIIKGETKWHELWLDYRMKDILYPLIKNRMKKAVQNGCDGLEIDCLGAYNHDDLLKRMKEQGKVPLNKEDAYNFAVDLSSMAHELGISIGLKNVAGIAKRLVNKFEFAVVESCSRSSKVCALYEDFPKQGKAVFTIHYGNYGSFQNQVKTMVKEQKNLGYTCTFNNDDNLDYPGFSYDCDTGSIINASGSSTSSNKSSISSSSSSNKSSSSSNSSNSSNNSKTKSNTISTQKPKQSNTPNTNISSNSTTKSIDSTTKSIDPTTQNSTLQNATTQNAATQNAVAQSISGSDVYTLNATDASYTDLNNYTGPNPDGSIVASSSKQSLDNYKEGNDSNKEKPGKGKTVAFIAVGGAATVAAVFLFVKKRNKKYDNAILL
ncbi:hypothetical protein BCR32DRAFT_292625 [Anaeromyces robustus]|uniref:alpha-galactosidase n=1 Tax=Anaeromyces robustus TaxID=1754192 RepID=A0A1Y1X9P4_9FUNG|nr:hypothetical protein BCR32DRAFT_292625 [Anaeromyces robustus]|eukprot:ORX82465.1 hypothetical protein BCR32DRAFT_292625 [Anaeromyces robustus]